MKKSQYSNFELRNDPRIWLDTANNNFESKTFGEIKDMRR
jgi:hypothetical protein